MTTLVIHIADRSTDFLKPIYTDQPDWTIVNSREPIPNLEQIISEHDRIIMMGHGCPQGLFGPGRNGLIINSSHIELLRTKQLIAIWCNADMFFTNCNLHGFYTGMIISEIGEAYYVGINDTVDIVRENVKEANKLLADCIATVIPLVDLNPTMLMVNEAKHIFTEFSKNNKIIRFNSNRLYQN